MKKLNRPSAMPSIFSTFAGSRFLNRDAVIEALQQVCRQLCILYPAVRHVYLFGSFANGVPTPRSDIDLLVVAEGDCDEAIREALLDVPMPVELFVIDPRTFAKQLVENRGVVAHAVQTGRKIL